MSIIFLLELYVNFFLFCVCFCLYVYPSSGYDIDEKYSL